MAGAPKKYKAAVVDDRKPEEIAIQSAINSAYNVIVPMVDAKYAYIKHPILQKTLHFSTDSDGFFSTILELSQKGLREKLRSEITNFAENIDIKWFDVLERLNLTENQNTAV